MSEIFHLLVHFFKGPQQSGLGQMEVRPLECRPGLQREVAETQVHEPLPAASQGMHL